MALARSFIVWLFCVLAGLANANPLPVNQAFVSSWQVQNNQLSVQIAVREGYYLYKDKFALYADGATLTIPLPVTTVSKEDPLFGTVEVYTQTVAWQQSVPSDQELTLWYQGCWEGGVCYPRQKLMLNQASGSHTSDVEQVAQNNSVLQNISNTTARISVVAGSQSQPSQQQTQMSWSELFTTSNAQQITNQFMQQHWWALLLLLFTAGVLLAFTPCVLPMVPIVYGMIMQQKHTPTARQSGLLVGVYVVGMTLAFSALGVIIALLGANLQQALQQPVFIVLFVGLLIVLAGGMFDWYQIQMPAWITNRLTAPNKFSGYVGAFLLGMLSVLIVGPCVTPPLVAVLLFIGQTGDLLLGGFGLAALAIGMGAPLIVVACVTTRILPRTGEWMVLIKGAFGFGLLALALYMLDRIAPIWLTLLLGAFLLLLLAASIWHVRIACTRTWRTCLDAVMILAFLLAGMLVLRVTEGTLQQQSAGSISTTQPQTTASALNLQGEQYTLAQLRQSISSYNGTTLVYITADWCISCRVLKQTTFANSQVVAALQALQFLVVDVTLDTAENKAIQSAYGVIGPPTFLLFNGTHRQSNGQLVGEVGVQDLLQFIRGA